RRAPTWEVIPAVVQGQSVRFDLGDEDPCNDKNLPECREIWAVYQVNPGAAPGSVLETSVSITSSDPQFSPDSGFIFTSVGSLAIRNGRIPLDAGVVRLRAHVGRTAMHSPFDPSPPTIALTQGPRIRLRAAGGGAGGGPLSAVPLPAEALECNGRPAPRLPARCKLVDVDAWKPFGLLRLNIYKNGDFAQNNNALVRLTLDDLPMETGFGPDLELTLDANGVTYTDDATFEAVKRGTLLVYAHSRFDP